MRYAAVIILLSMVTLGLGQRNAWALAQFRKVFTAKYVEKHKSQEFKTAVKKASCYLCHIRGAKKDVHNEFGEALKKLIAGDVAERRKLAKAGGGLAADRAELDKILAELKVALKKSEDIESHTGETFGQRIKSGLLPVDPDWARKQYQKKKAEQEKRDDLGPRK